MGCCFINRSASSASIPPPKRIQPNPDPNNYIILRSQQVGSCLVVQMKYLDCTNYEGIKILLFTDTTLSQLHKQKVIDPHFSDNKTIKSPFARFEPTPFGWSTAVYMAAKLDTGDEIIEGRD